MLMTSVVNENHLPPPRAARPALKLACKASGDTSATRARNVGIPNLFFRPAGLQSLSSSSNNARLNQMVSQRSTDDARDIWRRLINQQILLNRMERENAKIMERGGSGSFGAGGGGGGGAASGATHDVVAPASGPGERISYLQLPDCPSAAADSWHQLLQRLSAAATADDDECDVTKQQLSALVYQGVPLSRRAEVWQLLVSCHRSPPSPSSSSSCCSGGGGGGSEPPVATVPNYNAPYQQLIGELTSFQREILTDLGRTFPHHPYFRSPFGAGQLEMFNVLKAISLLDPELGYCQGLGFVAGILLLHMAEKEAYGVMKHMLFQLQLRKQYMPDLAAMHIQMYQLSRLLHDLHRELYDHLEKFEVSPMLYSTPWFMTLFASQFPIGFASRVFDLFLLCGVEALFCVSVALLAEHERHLLSLDGMEEIMAFIKGSLCCPTVSTARSVFARAASLQISQRLLTYEVEYHVLQEEVLSCPSADSDINRLGASNQKLKRQLIDLLQQLQAARDNSQMLSAQNTRLETRLRAAQHHSDQLLALCRHLVADKTAAAAAAAEGAADTDSWREQLPPHLRTLLDTVCDTRSDQESFPRAVIKSTSAANLTRTYSDPVTPTTTSSSALRCSHPLSSRAGNGSVGESGMVQLAANSSLTTCQSLDETDVPTIVLDHS